MSTVVDIDDLHVDFDTDQGTVAAVDGVSLQIEAGEVLAIVGESGSGKTVTARTILGLLPKTANLSGAVVVAGTDVVGLDHARLRELRGTDAAMVFQEPSTALNPVYTVGWQIAEGIRAHHKVSKKEARERAIDILRRVGIPEPETRVDYYPHQFSGGQKQRVVIAMALVLEPAVIIADEPTTALDVTVQAEILDLLRRCRDEFGAAIALITHNMGVVADLADRVAVMYRGKIVEQAPVRELFANPQDDYTKRLLGSVLRVGDGSARRAALLSESQQPLAEKQGEPASTAGTSAAAKKAATETTATETTAAATETAATETLAVEANGLRIVYPGGLGKEDFVAVDGIDFFVRPGEVLGLVGESGSGKSTIGRAIAGLTKVTEGSLKVFGQEMLGIKRQALRRVRSDIGFVFQDPATSFNPLLTIGQCIAEPLIVAGEARTADDARDRVQDLIEAVDLPRGFADRFPHELSGGQRQRASLARALALRPKLVIADEPTSALDVSVQATVLELFDQLQRDFGFASIFITHDLAVVELVADRVAVLSKGKLVEQGETDQVLLAPNHPYTKRLVGSVPVPDPVEQAKRREALA